MGAAPIFVISGGTGASGEQLVRTALAQFEDATVPIILVPHVRKTSQIEKVVQQAAATEGTIVHTLVSIELRTVLINLARERNVVAIDLMGQLLLRLTKLLGREPLGQPGLYRQLREDYFKRIEAIEFTVDHDDGQKPNDLHRAQIVLTGVSRVGKTPLSMYLSTRGWKVANVPLVKEVGAPKALFEIDRRRVVGLTIDPDQLVLYRRRRQHSLGVPRETAYTDVDEIAAEVKFACQVFQRGQFAVVDITDKPIEESAEEVIAHVTRR
jgi:regulator of PEP synthase PpsR (kinase-PPPase family)